MNQPVGGVDSVTTTELPASRGRVAVDDVVLARIAAGAARRVPGVHGLGDVPTGPVPGVVVARGDGPVVLGLGIVVEYGTPVEPVARAVRGAVAGLVHRITGLAVGEVDVTVRDVHVPGGALAG